MTDTPMTNLPELVKAATPGPWDATNHFADETTPCNCAYVLSEVYAGSICTVSIGNDRPLGKGGNDSPPQAEAAANGRLIALSPTLAALVLEARTALGDLAFAEADYRSVHDLYGEGSREAGHAWDLMARAGNCARTTLAKLGDL